MFAHAGFAFSYGRDCLKKSGRRESHTICSVTITQNTQYDVYKKVSLGIFRQSAAAGRHSCYNGRGCFVSPGGLEREEPIMDPQTVIALCELLLVVIGIVGLAELRRR